MNKFEKKLLSRYKKLIKRSVARKYWKMADTEAQSKKIYLSDIDPAKQLKRIKSEIYQTYLPLIDIEVADKVEQTYNSPKFALAVEKLKQLSKKRLHYKSLKKFKECPIHVSDKFLSILNEEMGEHNIRFEDLRYLVLVVFYAILDKIKQGYRIKYGNLFYMWCDKRDVRTNLPSIKQKIQEDRLIPRFRFSKAFDREYFHLINRNNEPIREYYRQKCERLLILLKIKKAGE